MALSTRHLFAHFSILLTTFSSVFPSAIHSSHFPFQILPNLTPSPRLLHHTSHKRRPGQSRERIFQLSAPTAPLLKGPVFSGPVVTSLAPLTARPVRGTSIGTTVRCFVFGQSSGGSPPSTILETLFSLLLSPAAATPPPNYTGLWESSLGRLQSLWSTVPSSRPPEPVPHFRTVSLPLSMPSSPLGSAIRAMTHVPLILSSRPPLPCFATYFPATSPPSPLDLLVPPTGGRHIYYSSPPFVGNTSSLAAPSVPCLPSPHPLPPYPYPRPPASIFIYLSP